MRHNQAIGYTQKHDHNRKGPLYVVASQASALFFVLSPVQHVPATMWQWLHKGRKSAAWFCVYPSVSFSKVSCPRVVRSLRCSHTISISLYPRDWLILCKQLHLNLITKHFLFPARRVWHSWLPILPRLTLLVAICAQQQLQCRDGCIFVVRGAGKDLVYWLPDTGELPYGDIDGDNWVIFKAWGRGCFGFYLTLMALFHHARLNPRRKGQQPRTGFYDSCTLWSTRQDIGLPIAERNRNPRRSSFFARTPQPSSLELSRQDLREIHLVRLDFKPCGTLCASPGCRESCGSPEARLHCRS